MGPDFKKAFLKKNSDKVPAGEEVRYVLFAESEGNSWRRGISMGAGGAIGAIADHRSNKAREELRGELEQQGASDAAAWPEASPYWVVLTDKSLRVYEGRVNSKWAGEGTAYPLDHIADLDFQKKKLISKLAVAFSDGSSIDLDIGMANKPKPFLEEFAALRARM